MMKGTVKLKDNTGNTSFLGAKDNRYFLCELDIVQ